MTGPRTCFKPLPAMIDEINRHLIGWSRYFGRGYPRAAFRHINWCMRDRLTRHLQRRSQRPFKPPEGMSSYAHLRKMGLVYS